MIPSRRRPACRSPPCRARSTTGSRRQQAGPPSRRRAWCGWGCVSCRPLSWTCAHHSSRRERASPRHASPARGQPRRLCHQRSSTRRQQQQQQGQGYPLHRPRPCQQPGEEPVRRRRHPCPGQVERQPRRRHLLRPRCLEQLARRHRHPHRRRQRASQACPAWRCLGGRAGRQDAEGHRRRRPPASQVGVACPSGFAATL